MVKDLSALVVSVIVALLISFLGMMVYSSLYPQPEGLNTSDDLSMSLFLEGLPNKAYAIKIFTNILIAFCGSLLATLISKSKKTAGILGLLLCLSLMFYRDLKYDYPDLFFYITALASVLSGALGIFIGIKK
ncbi:MAG: hypothetical protein RLZZ546_3246 [Bacteroidota bacterium]|jgi:hypothetical protein